MDGLAVVGRLHLLELLWRAMSLCIADPHRTLQLWHSSHGSPGPTHHRRNYVVRKTISLTLPISICVKFHQDHPLIHEKSFY